MIPQHMRAVQLTGHGGLDKLFYRTDVPVPQLQPGEVLIAVRACGVNNTDINTRTGWYAPSVTTGITEELATQGVAEDHADLGSWDRKGLGFPRIQGAAPAGIIVAAGSGVDTQRIGTAVVVDPVVRDMSLTRWARGVQYIGSERDGGYAQYVAVPDVNALPVQSSLTFAELAALPCAYQTAEEMQLRTRVGKSDTVVVTGASGGVGSANVQLAKLRGARVVAIASQDKEARVRELGADLFIARGSPDLSGQLGALVSERGVDVVLDVAGGDDVLHLWRSLSRAGRFATGGAIAGPMALVDMRDLIYKDLEMYGIANPEPEAMRNLVRYVEAGTLRPIVSQVFELSDLARAQAAFAKKGHVGKIVVDIDNAAGSAA
ncbi:zinc-binding dehydrogenase [Variovorax sp. LjRoot178]|uniref:zinc-binding dehydrogenase n=1 Tax=Variovorax sp. LjRoot178 TaxID=3342277 RepID=UPI003ED01364